MLIALRRRNWMANSRDGILIHDIQMWPPLTRPEKGRLMWGRKEMENEGNGGGERDFCQIAAPDDIKERTMNKRKT